MTPAPALLALAGRRVAMVVFSGFPGDPRPRRAVEALLDEGAEMELICMAEPGKPAREEAGPLHIRRIPIRHRRGGQLAYLFQYGTFLVASVAVLGGRALKRRYDLVYVHNMPDILVLAALGPKLFGAKVVLDMHDPMPELMTAIYGLQDTSLPVRVIRSLEKLSLRFSDAVITVNVACKEIFSRRSCPPEKIAVVMNSPDEAIFRLRPPQMPAPRPDGRFVVMYHGSIVERNGLDLAVDAIRQIRRDVPEVLLKVYGVSTPFLETLMEKARRDGLDSHVEYLGPRRLEEIAAEIGQCDAGVIPNHRNAFTEINTPTRIFEYLVMGKPVIAPRTRGVEDYFGPGSLFYFEAGDAEDLASTIGRVARSPREAFAVAQCGQQAYLAHTWREERKALVDSVARLAGNGAR